MPLTATARPPTLAAQVARQLEARICAGDWPVGSRIPAEAELMKALGVSRNTLREGVRSLVHVGLLESRVGDGTYVRAFSELEAPLVRRAQRAGAVDAIEFRSVLERGAARLAAARRSSADIARLRQLLQRQREAGLADNREAYAQADSALHSAVLACSGNALLSEVYGHLGGALKLAVSPELWDRALALREINLHAALVEAIAAGDEAAAELAASRLIDALQGSLQQGHAGIEPPRATKATRRPR
jgi:DNA-binding FadR family transcriptional regulator